ncbi:MAG: ABA4-like family protein [Pseudomonadota bacterium]
MEPAELFRILNLPVLPAWLLLAILPRWRYTQLAVFGLIIPILGVAYTAILIQATTAGGGFEAPDFSSFEGVSALMQNPYALVAGWAHYLAFDLFVGAWIARDSAVSGVNRFLIIIPLFFTLMAGPFGLILYLIMRQIARKSILIEPSPQD